MTKNDDNRDDDGSAHGDEGSDATEPRSDAMASSSAGGTHSGDDGNASESSDSVNGDDAAAGESIDESAGDELAAAQLGNQRYILAAFFAGGMILAYVLGRALHGTWAYAANKDLFALRFPALAALPDDTKLTYSMLVAGVVALVAVVRTIRRPDTREWADEVSTELTKVKWPTRKDVQNSTIVVLATSAFATSYLFLLDQFWSFVTNLIYGTGT
jgi:preprotein translocase subunit SecE